MDAAAAPSSGAVPPTVSLTADAVVTALAAVADPGRASGLAGFFKTGAGEYGEGDLFLGITVPVLRATAKPFLALPLGEVRELLESDFHEHRFVALLILDAQAKKWPGPTAEFYLEAVRAGRVNNWDLVDVSAEFILGTFLYDRSRDVLFELAASDSVWQRRVAMISTFGFIKQGDPSTTLEIAEQLLSDTHDLIQKAVGWMLREAGKRIDRTVLLGFLDEHAARMSRTSLSYATEHLSPEQRAHYRALR